MPGNTENQKKRMKDTIGSAVFYILFAIVGGTVYLLVRHRYAPTGWISILLLGLSIINYGSIIPICIIVKERLKEIEGGEEDAAAQY